VIRGRLFGDLDHNAGGGCSGSLAWIVHGQLQSIEEIAVKVFVNELNIRINQE
jgi:hypothetical protein